jgi:ssDNA-specific exonuclease RecJ
MFVLTQSCDSGSAVIPWTRAFRHSIDLDIAAGRLSSASDARDLIHAIAPEGGFPTDTPSQLLLDFVPSLMSIEMLAQGQSPRQVFEVLSKTIKADRFIQAVATVEKWFKKTIDQKLELDLKPNYNIDIPYLLNSSGFVVEIGDLD